MKLINFSFIAVIALFSLTSCSKELSLELANPTITDPVISEDSAFKEFIADKKFQLKAFYSDIPIDYIETDDTVKQETNLWAYVKYYLKDDINIFKANGTDINIEQNANKIPGITDSVLYRNYSVIKDASGVHMNFLDYEYNPLMYDVYKTGPDYFILSIKWKNGATLFSRFEMIP